MKDILLDADNDLLVKNGDFVVGDSEEQDIALIVTANPGGFPQYPVIGFAIGKRIRNTINKADFEKELDTQLQLDGFRNLQVDWQDGIINDIRATRN